MMKAESEANHASTAKKGIMDKENEQRSSLLLIQDQSGIDQDNMD